MKRGLSPKQKIFVGEYLIDLNATQAAARAGYSDTSIGRQLITKNHVAEAIQAAMAKRERRTEITQDRVLKEYARLAFFDIRKLVDAEGKPLPVQKLDDDTARAIVGIDVVNVPGTGKEAPGEVLKFKMADKKGALDSCARHLGMFEKDNKQNNPGESVADALRAASRI